mmetsp:Transcript_12095/g.23073  ORF Transcript_12095/g.23073 Transcript_12095/m.23073 type:complete len:220 (+) Transcript_12095:247-906(+)
MVQAKTVLLPIGNGSQETEASVIVDLLRQAGADVTVASVEETLMCTMEQRMRLEADCLIGDCRGNEYDLIVLPGGNAGSQRLIESAVLTQLLKDQANQGRRYAAVGTSPALVLGPLGLLAGRGATAHPSVVQQLTILSSKGDCSGGRVVIDGNVTTSRGPGTAQELSLCLVEQLFGRPRMLELAEGMMFPVSPYEDRPPLQPMEWEGVYGAPPAQSPAD